MNNKLKLLRSKIDSLDGAIIERLSERLAVAREIGAVKQKLSLPIRNLAREKELMKFYKKCARQYGLPSEAIQRIFAHIIDESKKMQG